MNIHEFQAKELFKKYGIRTPKGLVVKSRAEAEQAASTLGGNKLVVKSQIHAGGRGKGTLLENPSINGVKVVDNANAADYAQSLLGQTLQTIQTGPEGRKIKQVLIEEASSIAKELYTAILLDRDTSCVTFIVSTEGGMDIEAVAHDTPEKIVKQAIDPATGFMPYHGRKLAKALQLSGEAAKQAGQLFAGLYNLFVQTDASLVEINPLVVTTEGNIVALDGKINFDENALSRQKEISAMRDVDEEDPKEQQAKDAGLSYVALNGTIGCLVNGAGLAMATMDIIKYAGGFPANFLDVGGGATAQQVTQAFKIILADPNVKAILINIFAGIAKCDVIANGVVAAAKEVGLKVPLVVRLEGTNVELGKEILKNNGLKIIPAGDMLDAAQKVVAASRGAA